MRGRWAGFGSAESQHPNRSLLVARTVLWPRRCVCLCACMCVCALQCSVPLSAISPLGRCLLHCMEPRCGAAALQPMPKPAHGPATRQFCSCFPPSVLPLSLVSYHPSLPPFVLLPSLGAASLPPSLNPFMPSPPPSPLCCAVRGLPSRRAGHAVCAAHRRRQSPSLPHPSSVRCDRARHPHAGALAQPRPRVCVLCRVLACEPHARYAC